jgi:hypothetical protein
MRRKQKKVNETWPGKGKACISCRLQRKYGGVDLKDQVLQPYVTERKKMTKWYMKMFRLLNVTILNCLII